MLTWTECPILVVVGLRNKISPALTWRQLVCQCHWQQVGPAALSRGTHFLPTTRPLDDAAAAEGLRVMGQIQAPGLHWSPLSKGLCGSMYESVRAHGEWAVRGRGRARRAADLLPAPATPTLSRQGSTSTEAASRSKTSRQVRFYYFFIFQFHFL